MWFEELYRWTVTKLLYAYVLILWPNQKYKKLLHFIGVWRTEMKKRTFLVEEMAWTKAEMGQSRLLGEHREELGEEPQEMNWKLNICPSGHQFFYTVQNPSDLGLTSHSHTRRPFLWWGVSTMAFSFLHLPSTPHVPRLHPSCFFFEIMKWKLCDREFKSRCCESGSFWAHFLFSPLA